MAKRFSLEFKQQAIDYALSNSHESVAAVVLARAVFCWNQWGWSHESIYLMLNNPHLISGQQRILDLEKEVKQLREANDILKKAHVYFLTDYAKKSTR